MMKTVRCIGGVRHWFTRRGSVGERLAYCDRCGAVNPRCSRHGCNRILMPMGVNRYDCRAGHVTELPQVALDMQARAREIRARR
jgi:hypothetical protein